jgi:hypothetical protein
MDLSSDYPAHLFPARKIPRWQLTTQVAGGVHMLTM